MSEQAETATPQEDGPPTTQCSKCGQPMLFVVNVDSGKEGPADARTVVYFVLKARDAKGRLRGMTAKKLLERLQSMTVMLDGELVTLRPEDIQGFFPSHFNTCPSAAFFAQNGGFKRGGKS